MKNYDLYPFHNKCSKKQALFHIYAPIPPHIRIKHANYQLNRNDVS